VDHLKHIPREVVGIVKDDPKVLDNFETFLVALRGPPSSQPARATDAGPPN
jgi:hypothetical protein